MKEHGFTLKGHGFSRAISDTESMRLQPRRALLPIHPPTPNFDHIARPYRWLEYLTFGPYLERTRFHFLNHLGTHSRALILGDGDGRFTARLLAANPEVTVDAIDSSATMLKLLTERVTRLGPAARDRLKTIHSDALALNLEGAKYDLIVTHFFLDCFTEDELNALLSRLLSHLAPGATWLVSEFAIPESQPAATISRMITSSLYHGFHILTGLKTDRLPGYATLLARNGFSGDQQRSFLGGLLTSQLWLRRR